MCIYILRLRPCRRPPCWLAGWLAPGLLACWLAGCWPDLVGLLAGWLLAGWLAAGCLVGRLAGSTEDAFFYLPAPLWEHFGSLWMDLGGSWLQIELRLGSDWAPWLQIGVLRVTFAASRLYFGRALELHHCSWRSLGATLGASGIQNGRCRQPG